MGQWLSEHGLLRSIRTMNFKHTNRTLITSSFLVIRKRLKSLNVTLNIKIENPFIFCQYCM